MNINVKVVNQDLKVATNLKCLAEGSQQFVKFIFDLGEDWNNLVTFAQFVQGANAYNQYLDSNNSCFLPAEIKAGKCYMMLMGTRTGVIATTHFLALNIDENKYVSNASSTEITESLYEQLVDLVTASISAPYTASTVSQMTDKTHVYVYTGTESGYTNGNWYYWNGSAWASGGVYNAVAVDNALSTTSTNAVQNKVIKAALDLKVNAADICTLAEVKTYIGF